MIQSKVRSGGILLLLAHLMLCNTALADGPVWQVRAGAGVQHYGLSFEDIVVPFEIVPGGSEFTFRDGFDISDDLLFGSAGVTAGFGKVFIDLSGQWSDDGNDEGEQFQGANPFPGLGINHSYKATFDRSEWNATVGYGVTRNMSVFLGYKNAETNLRNTLFPIGQIDVADVIFDGDRVIEFSYEGAFAGASFAVPIDAWSGAFSIQTAVAVLDGEFRDRFVGDAFVVTPFSIEALPDGFIDSTIKGDSTGINVGVAWTAGLGNIAEGLSYTIGVDHSQYEFETNQSTTGNFEEKNTRARFDLRYRF